MEKKRYLGDGVYVENDGQRLILTAEDGIQATNTIYLEPEIVGRFMQYIAELSREGARRAAP